MLKLFKISIRTIRSKNCGMKPANLNNSNQHLDHNLRLNVKTFAFSKNQESSWYRRRTRRLNASDATHLIRPQQINKSLD